MILSLSNRFATAYRGLVSPDSQTLTSVQSEILDELQATRQTQAEILEQLKQLERLSEQLERLRVQDREQQLVRWREIGDLRGFAWQIYSQNGEDGILLEIFRRIGTTNCFFVEFGVESGVQCNTRYFVEYKDWSGLYFEARESDLQKLREMWKDKPKIQAQLACVTSSNFEQLLREFDVPVELDLLSIDIDSNDYWVWKSLETWKPRVVVIEYNSFHNPPAKWVMKEDLNFQWDQTTYFGASFTSLCLLGRAKGYTPVGTDPNGINLFFVRNDCMNEQFVDAELHYLFQPFAYTRPPTGSGPFEEI